MKFVFPQNYDFKNKLFGVIDYSTAFLNLLWDSFVFLFVYFVLSGITFQIFVFVILCFPLLLLSFSGFNGENIIYVFAYLIHFMLKPKLFLYKKS